LRSVVFSTVPSSLGRGFSWSRAVWMMRVERLERCGPVQRDVNVYESI